MYIHTCMHAAEYTTIHRTETEISQVVRAQKSPMCVHTHTHAHAHTHTHAHAHTHAYTHTRTHTHTHTHTHDLVHWVIKMHIPLTSGSIHTPNQAVSDTAPVGGNAFRSPSLLHTSNHSARVCVCTCVVCVYILSICVCMRMCARWPPYPYTSACSSCGIHNSFESTGNVYSLCSKVTNCLALSVKVLVPARSGSLG